MTSHWELAAAAADSCSQAESFTAQFQQIHRFESVSGFRDVF